MLREAVLQGGALWGDCVGVDAVGGRAAGERRRGSAGGRPKAPNSDSAGHHDEDDEKDTRARSWRGHCNPRRPPWQESGMSFIFSSTHVRA